MPPDEKSDKKPSQEIIFLPFIKKVHQSQRFHVGLQANFTIDN